ncbi:hypothetical protein GGX14DRAFT_192785 [Mycena pura]|uniref:Uncharacterized protein n=1 Tax=Mycena pura TaxID=153505 RepID=A0AAD6VXE6_9AGAR|nr:hypothetical protein GGX14DRAFT_192785 [Mycena pura]
MVQFLSPDKAGLLSTILEAILYGFSVLMFIATLWILTRRRTAKQINRPMVVIACLLFILSTIHLGVDISRLDFGFIESRSSYPGGPTAFFANPSEKSFVFKNAIYTFQTVLGDGVVIYRCYKVWQSIWVVMLPSILWIGVATAGAGSVYTCTTPFTDATNIYALRLGHWITAFYSTTLSCNLTATLLLAYRLWTINRNVHESRVGNGVVIPVLLIVVDAGALYSMTLIAALVAFALKSNGQYVVLDMVTPIISIAFYMVIIRLGIAQNVSRSLNGGVSTHGASIPRMPLSRAEVSNRLKPMHVRIDVEQMAYGGHPDDKAQEAGVSQDEIESATSRRSDAVTGY